MAVHDVGVARNDAKILRNSARIAKDRAKALLAAALRRSSCGGGLARLAKAGGCSKRTLEKAASEQSLPSLEVAINMLDEDPTILDELLRAKGWQLTPIAFDPDVDAFETFGDMADATGTLGHALRDRVLSHTEILDVAPKISRSLPGQLAIVRRAAELRGAA